MRVKRDWQLQDAKASLSQVVNQAQEDGPQRITRHGRPAAVVLSERDFEQLIARKRGSLAEFLALSPLTEIDMNTRVHADTGREIEL